MNEYGISSSAEPIDVYKSIKLRGATYTSKLSKEISTVDYFIETKNERIGAIKFYVVSDYIVYALMQVYEIINKMDHFLFVKPTESNEVITISDISEKALFIKIGRKEIITFIPNKFEKS